MSTNIESEKYGELLQAIAQIIAEKDTENEQLKNEIERLNTLLNEAEKKGL